MGKVKKANKWVTHELSDKQKPRREKIATLSFQRIKHGSDKELWYIPSIPMIVYSRTITFSNACSIYQFINLKEFRNLKISNFHRYKVTRDIVRKDQMKIASVL